jgi:glycosyltransferase involved in cell wall biosynthesis
MTKNGKPHVMIFIDWYKPGYKAGGPIRSVSNMVARLKNDFRFSIVTRDTDYCEDVPYSNVRSDQWNESEDGSRIYYFSRHQLNRRNIQDLIRSGNADVIYLNGIYSFYFTLYPLFVLRALRKTKVVVAARGMLSPGSLGVKSGKKKLFLAASRFLGLFRNVLFHATTEIEKQEIRNAFGQSTAVHVAGNLSESADGAPVAFRKKDPGTIVLTSVARISPEKNLLYCLQVLQHVTAEVIFDIYGPIYNQEYWEQCSQAISRLPANVHVTYKGSIPAENVYGVLSSAHFLFLPSTGENFGHIILQSLSAGCPVIISNRTPWKDLEKSNAGFDLPLEQMDLFKAAIEKAAAMGQDEYNASSAAASALAKKYIADASLLQQNKELFL